ncbi:HAMP domain-containing sensor histidine kinase [Methylobacterium sp. Leaf456]|uniref:sensor histidine kinase n=1 Tax=Methylobacterium sp. Leaf456 TaxID=1736382 RepID=UPI000A51CFF6|nr:HAMP domain-containing sensor histidine kinase [Methylobacterium sp. Leaf456]
MFRHRSPSIRSSLQARLVALWIALLASAAATAYLLFGLYTQSTAVQISQAEIAVGRACREIIDRYTVLVRKGDEPAGEALTGVVLGALAHWPGIEGGVWSGAEGSLAYAFPSYEGSGPKTDLPLAERDTIAAVNAESRSLGRSVVIHRISRTQALLVQACPLPGRAPGLTGWTMTRAHVNDGPAYTRFLAALGFLAVAVIGAAGFLGHFLYGYSRRIARLEAALAAPEREGADLAHLDRTGERELDRLVDALNAAGGRLREAREQAVAAERFAALGRLSADIAHEIRNPIAAMRLKAENALATGEPERAATALRTILGQIGRVETLVRDLLHLTQPRTLHREPTDLRRLLTESAQWHEDAARAREVRLRVEADALPAAEHPHLDRAQVQRALDNLLLNALRHAPPGSAVTLDARRVLREGAARLELRVADEGPGVDPAIRPRLFEPFVTGRSDGTGLGLAIVSKIAQAHRGQARLLDTGPATTFLLDLPWQPS